VFHGKWWTSPLQKEGEMSQLLVQVKTIVQFHLALEIVNYFSMIICEAIVDNDK
jgi:hypothetical protein